MPEGTVQGRGRQPPPLTPTGGREGASPLQALLYAEAAPTS